MNAQSPIARADGARGKQHLGVAQSDRLHHAVARELGVAIVTGAHKPGDVLPGEHAASEQLRISRPAYREALKMLAAKGLVESRPKAGTRVCPRENWNLLDPDVLGWMLEKGPPAGMLDELFELRSVVEPAAAALAAQRRTERQLRTLRAALAAMGHNPPDSPAGQAADELFHETILDAAGNGLMVRLASVIAVSVSFVAAFKRERRVPRDSWPDHESLFKAIEAGRPSEARKAMLRLLSHARDDVVPAQAERDSDGTARLS